MQPELPAHADHEALFQPLAEPSRRAIFELLIQGPRAVKVIAAELPITQSCVSQHLKVLRVAGLVTEEREGRSRIYSPNPAILERLSLQFGTLRDRALDHSERGQADACALTSYDEIDSSMQHWAQTWQEHDPLSVGLIVRLRLVARYLETLSERSAARFDLSSAQVLLLATLDRPETPRDSTLTELSRICHISLPATSRHIERTEQLGLITRRQDQNDARSQLIRITDSGRELLHQIMRSQRKIEHAPIYDMSVEERLRLTRLLRPLLKRLKDNLGD
ncbi:MAG TPA: metalloregulator ArsR/SmtB family transcription factor [Pseudomonas sp.]|jgi:DNA-binding MarR family transcriptional regulator